MKFSIQEVARSIELYNVAVGLKTKSQSGERLLAFTKEPILRPREEVGKVVCASGSYDPLTVGHCALFRKGLEVTREIESRKGSNSLEELLIFTALSHADKKVDLMKNSSIPDRIHAQEGFASCQGNVSLAFVNAPLYIHFIELIEKAYGPTVDIYFLLGADVMEKVVDKKYYHNDPTELKQVVADLFNHRFIVSDRLVTYPANAGKEARLLTAAKIIEENPVLGEYSTRILPISLEGNYEGLDIPITEVSSSLVREKRNQRAALPQLEAVGISEFVDDRELYLDNDKYTASVCTREMFADHYRAKRVPIFDYIHRVMEALERIDLDENLRQRVITAHEQKQEFSTIFSV